MFNLALEVIEDIGNVSKSQEYESATVATIDEDYFDDLAADIEGPTTPFIILCSYYTIYIIQ